jgi:hypothetical protein
MIVAHSGQVEECVLDEREFDLIVCASGFESRAVHASRKLRTAANGLKVVLPFRDRKVLSRRENDSLFAARGFLSTEELDGGDFRSLAELFIKFLTATIARSSGDVAVFIDYSCMTRSWYGAFIYVLFERTFARGIYVVFGYSIAKYASPVRVHINTIAGPLDGFIHLAPLESVMHFPGRRLYGDYSCTF